MPHPHDPDLVNDCPPTSLAAVIASQAHGPNKVSQSFLGTDIWILEESSSLILDWGSQAGLMVAKFSTSQKGENEASPKGKQRQQE